MSDVISHTSMCFDVKCHFSFHVLHSMECWCKMWQIVISVLISLLNSDLLAPNGDLLEEGDTLRRHLYADTLQQIAEHGADYFYDSDFTESMVEELREDYNSIITAEDIRNYTPLERRVTKAGYRGLDVMGVAPPGSGAVLALILNILDGKHKYWLHIFFILMRYTVMYPGGIALLPGSPANALPPLHLRGGLDNTNGCPSVV